MFLFDSNEKFCVILNNFSPHLEFCWSAKFTYLINLYLATADLTKLYCANIDKSGVFGRLVPLNLFQNFLPHRKSWLVEMDTLRACKFMLVSVLYKVGSRTVTKWPRKWWFRVLTPNGPRLLTPLRTWWSKSQLEYLKMFYLKLSYRIKCKNFNIMICYSSSTNVYLVR